MRRLAAHYIWYKEVLRLHYIEMQEDGTLLGVYPLTEEIAGTIFYDGVLLPLPSGRESDEELVKNWREITEQISIGEVVCVVRLANLPAASAKLGTNDSGGNCHIERL